MLKIVGDISLTDGYFDVGIGVGSKLAYGFDPFHGINRNNGELWVGNFEGVAADTTTMNGTAANQFRVSPNLLKNIKHMDLYGFANNHAMQHGGEAYKQTEKTLLAQGSLVFGTDSSRSVILDHQNQKVSITGFSQRIDAWKEKPLYWYNPEYYEIENEVKNLPQNAFKIAYIHWGNEFINYPSSHQKKFAHWLVDVGFDMIIGMHPHILQGYEVYKKKYIFYSLGNFVFDMAWEPTHYGVIVNVDFEKKEPVVSYDYVKIEKDFSPSIIREKLVPECYRFKSLNKLISKEENLEEYHWAIYKYYKQYKIANYRDISGKMLKHPTVALTIIKDFVKRKL